MDPGDSSASDARAVRLVEMAPAVFHALAAGDLVTANGAAAIELTPYFVSPELRSMWVRRSMQLAGDPAAAAWITRAIFDDDRQRAVGCAGFHGPPDAAGMVEVGYSVDPDDRGRGYARAALGALLERAEREPAVRTVRASIRPDNAASRGVVSRYGFVEVGEQWDDEDGLETIFEVPAGAAG